MLVHSVLPAQSTPQAVSERNLISVLTQVTKMHSTRIKSKESYLFASLDSTLGFRLQLKFLKNQVAVRGSLISVNGKPVFIGEMYRDALVRALESALRISVRFFFSKDIDGLVFHYNFKFDSQSPTPEILLLEHMKPLVQALPQIHSQLASFGVVRKLNLAAKRSLVQRLTLLSKAVSIVSNRTMEPEEQRRDARTKEQKGSVFKYYQEILETEKSNGQGAVSGGPFSSFLASIKKGGYFEVQKKTCKIISESSPGNPKHESIEELAVKTVRKDHPNCPPSSKKIQKQLKILNQIQNPNHSLTYWLKSPAPNPSPAILGQPPLEKPQQKLYMDYIEETLDDYIYGRPMGIGEKLAFAGQIVDAVKILHRCGIVHRDLKPENLLVKTSVVEGEGRSRSIKVIDFGESILMSQKFPKEKANQDDLLGSTIPYSPLECYTFCQQGFNNKEIDLWSVGLLIYELVHKKNPLSYSRCFSADIYKGWRLPDEFSLFPIMHKGRGVRAIERVLDLLTLNSVCIRQGDRLSIGSMGRLVRLVLEFAREMRLI